MTSTGRRRPQPTRRLPCAARMDRRRLAGRSPTRRFISWTAVCNRDRKSTRLNSSHDQISYAVFCLKKKKMDVAANTTPTKPRLRSTTLLPSSKPERPHHQARQTSSPRDDLLPHERSHDVRVRTLGG